MRALARPHSWRQQRLRTASDCRSVPLLSCSLRSARHPPFDSFTTHPHPFHSSLPPRPLSSASHAASSSTLFAEMSKALLPAASGNGYLATQAAARGLGHWTHPRAQSAAGSDARRCLILLRLCINSHRLYHALCALSCCQSAFSGPSTSTSIIAGDRRKIHTSFTEKGAEMVRTAKARGELHAKRLASAARPWSCCAHTLFVCLFALLLVC